MTFEFCDLSRRRLFHVDPNLTNPESRATLLGRSLRSAQASMAGVACVLGSGLRSVGLHTVGYFVIFFEIREKREAQNAYTRKVRSRGTCQAVGSYRYFGHARKPLFRRHAYLNASRFLLFLRANSPCLALNARSSDGQNGPKQCF